jgi:ribonuclease HI
MTDTIGISEKIVLLDEAGYASRDGKLKILGAASVYADGGVLEPRGCSAGSFAWIATNAAGEMIHAESGLIEANDYIPLVTNNQTEFLALLRALESMPDGWNGRVCSDSGITLGRFGQGWRLKNIPPSWCIRLGAVLRRLDLKPENFILHKGHPTAADLALGRGQRERSGRWYPVNIHQEACDKMCGKMLRRYRDLKTAEAE